MFSQEHPRAPANTELRSEENSLLLHLIFPPTSRSFPRLLLLISSACLLFFFHCLLPHGFVFLLSSLRFLSSLFSSSSSSYPYPSLPYLLPFLLLFPYLPFVSSSFFISSFLSFLPLLPPSIPIPIFLSAFLFLHRFSFYFNLLFHRPHSHLSLSFPSFPFLSLISLMPFSLITSFCFLPYCLSILFL